MALSLPSKYVSAIVPALMALAGVSGNPSSLDAGAKCSLDLMAISSVTVHCSSFIRAEREFTADLKISFSLPSAYDVRREKSKVRTSHSTKRGCND